MNLLSKTECSAMRGLAIVGIFIHNYLHLTPSMVKENEYLFNMRNVLYLRRILDNPDGNLILHQFSFFGHYGVPVFLFLSGYGLVLKYEQCTMDTRRNMSGSLRGILDFITHHFMKLFPMMLLGFACFAMIERITPGHHLWRWYELLAHLTMTINFFEKPNEVICPGPYWFFGLIMQLYIIYILILQRWRHWSVMALLIVVCWLLQAQCESDPIGDMLNRLRYNFIGSALPFCAGIAIARLKAEAIMSKLKTHGMLIFSIVLPVSILLIWATSQTFQTWLWTPVFIILFNVSVVKLLPNVLINGLNWIGGLSAAIFVCHPTTRKIFLPIAMNGDVKDGLVLYIIVTIVLAMLFNMVIRQMRKQPS